MQRLGPPGGPVTVLETRGTVARPPASHCNDAVYKVSGDRLEVLLVPFHAVIVYDEASAHDVIRCDESLCNAVSSALLVQEPVVVKRGHLESVHHTWLGEVKVWWCVRNDHKADEAPRHV
eukprot:1908672-Prymnesium_polylepis.1